MPRWPPGKSSKCRRSSDRPALLDCSSKCERTAIEVVLVAVAGVDPGAAQSGDGGPVLADQAHRVVGEPPFPAPGLRRSGLRVEWQLAVSEGERTRPELGEQGVSRLVQSAERPPELGHRDDAALRESPRCGGKAVSQCDLEERVGRMRRERVKQVRPRERVGDRAVAARRLALKAPRAVRRVAGVDERDDLLVEIRAVPPDAVRVDPLRAADRRPAVDEDDDGFRSECVDLLRIGPFERLDVEPGRRRAQVGVQDVHRRVPP